MTATEQAKIEIAAPGYLKNIAVIISEMGLRYKKELFPMKKEQVDLKNGPVHIADSKTANGARWKKRRGASICSPARGPERRSRT